jgi:hypothetical protein
LSRDELIALIEQQGKEASPEVFRQVVASALALGVTDTAVADKVGACAASIRRWETGRTCPYPIVRKFILAEILQMVIAVPV